MAVSCAGERGWTGRRRSSRRRGAIDNGSGGKIETRMMRGGGFTAAIASTMLRLAVVLLCVQTTGTAGVCTQAGSCDSSIAVCTARTIASGSCLTLATAGARAVFTVAARDSESMPVLDSLASFRVDLLRGDDGHYLAADATSFSQPCLSAVGMCISSVEIASGGAGCLEGGMLGATTGGGSGSGFLAR